MRMSAKAEYAVRAMVELAAAPRDAVVTADELARAQSIPAPFLLDILSTLRRGGLVRSQRGRDGGYSLARHGSAVSIADVMRCVDGPLVSVRGVGLDDLPYFGATAALADTWMALRASMRGVLEQTTVADVAAGALPAPVRALAVDYLAQESRRRPTLEN